MPRLTHRTIFYAIAGALGGMAAWPLVLALSQRTAAGLGTEAALGALTGVCIGAFTWSHEPIMGRQPAEALKRAGLGAVGGLLGGLLGAGIGTTAFSALGSVVAEWGGLRASWGILLAVALGWAILGAAVGISGGLMVRSRDRMLYGLSGGALGGFLGGAVYALLSPTGPWAALAGLALLGCSIAAAISLVEEAFVSATVKVIKGRHLNREFPLLKDQNVVGRDDRSDVCLSGAEGVLLNHAVIGRDRGRYVIRTDEDAKPVYVNQKMTTDAKLADGDVIRVGSVLLLFHAVRKAAAIAALVVLAALSPAAAGTPATATVTQFDLSAFPQVRAFISVLDADGRPVAGLTLDDVTLLENERPVAVDGMRMSGTEGSREPLSMAVVIDRSASMAGAKIGQAKEAVGRFLSLMEPGDRASLIAFSDTVAVIEGLTDQFALLEDRTRGIDAAGHTALFDAVAEGVRSLQATAGRKAVIVLTDGIANRGSLDFSQAIAVAREQTTSVYVIGLGADVRTARLERLAETTGGAYFFTPAADGLVEIYETISDRIRNEYVVTYETEARADYLRTLSLAVTGGLFAEGSYFQPRSSLFGAARVPAPWSLAVPFACVLGLTALSLRRIERTYATGHLSLVRGAGTRTDIDIHRTVTIGADRTSTLGLVKDGTVAGQHAEIVKENGQYVLSDKGAATGTFVNKERVYGTKLLKDGDIIEVGNATIVFNDGTARICSSCGEPVRAAAKFCARCGTKAAA